MTKQEFPLDDVLSAIFGVLVSPCGLDGVYSVLNFLTGDNLFTHQLPRAGRICEPYVIEQHPELASLKQSIQTVTLRNWRSWRTAAINAHGKTVQLQPLPKGAWTTSGPMGDLAEMLGSR